MQEALKLPKQTPEEKAVRNQALQEGLQKAVAVPYNLAMEVNRLWPALVQLATVGNLTTISDLQVGSKLAAQLTCLSLQFLQQYSLRSGMLASISRNLSASNFFIRAILRPLRRILKSDYLASSCESFCPLPLEDFHEICI